MKIVKPSFEILSATNLEYVTEQLKIIELAGRNCYKSEDKICEGSHDKIIGMLRLKKHFSVLEHGNMTVRMIGSRAFSHQLVRHRLAAYSQESQRYCNYNKGKFGSEVTFVEPVKFSEWDEELQKNFTTSLQLAEKCYQELVEQGMKAEDARGVLPNQCKTEVVVTMNLRSWMHFFSMRCDKHAQAEIRLIATGLLEEFNKLMPVIFEDLAKEYLGE
jgi:thymidylate synthase (FAD)